MAFFHENAWMRRLFSPLVFPAGLAILAWALWASTEFKSIAAGVAIFLFGMLSLERGFKLFNGGMFERLLRGATLGLGRSVSFGIVGTALMQSS